MNIKILNGAENFSLGELIELGRRLTNNQLEKMDLLNAIIIAEQDYLWRLRSISDLAREFSGKIYKQIETELDIAEKYANDPKRTESKYIGRSNMLDSRSLPAHGSLIIREYKYQKFGREKIDIDGSKCRINFETFKFVVVDTPSTLLRLNDNYGPIYLSVTGAVRAATGSSTNGWRFFNIN